MNKELVDQVIRSLVSDFGWHVKDYQNYRNLSIWVQTLIEQHGAKTPVKELAKKFDADFKG